MKEKPKLKLIKRKPKSKIPEITPVHLKILNTAMNAGTVFVAPEPSSKNNPDINVQLHRNLLDCAYLAKLGLLKDISFQFRADIKLAKNLQGTSFKVFVLTDMAILMLEEMESRVNN